MTVPTKCIFSRVLAISLLALAAVPAFAAWTVEAAGAPSGCTHVISDDNWQIGVYRYSDDNWSLGKAIGYNGSPYIAGSGDLDLRSLATDCGVVLKVSNNGALEKNNNIYSVRFPDSLESTAGNTFKSCGNLTNVVFGTGFKTVGGEMFRSCSALKTVTFPPGLETIGYYGFNGCSSLTDAEKAAAMTAARTLGVSRVKPIGKWSTQSGSAVHWVVEELPAETMLLVK